MVRQDGILIFQYTCMIYHSNDHSLLHVIFNGNLARSALILGHLLCTTITVLLLSVNKAIVNVVVTAAAAERLHSRVSY